MKIYLAGSISGGRDFEEGLQLIYAKLNLLGHKVLTPWVAFPKKDLKKRTTRKARLILKRDLKLLKRCDAAVVEVSQPSHGTGYELRTLEELGKPTLCLKDKSLKSRLTSAMIEGNRAFALRFYDKKNLAKTLQEFFEK